MHTCTHDCDCEKDGTIEPGQPFYMVYLNGGTQPTKRHKTEEVAMREAERLASSQRKDAFVLKVIAKFAPVSQTVMTKF